MWFCFVVALRFVFCGGWFVLRLTRVFLDGERIRVFCGRASDSRGCACFGRGFGVDRSAFRLELFLSCLRGYVVVDCVYFLFVSGRFV